MAGSKNAVVTAKRLIKALNTKGYKISLATRQFLGREGQFHNYYTVNEHLWDDEKKRFVTREVYSTTSTLRLLMFLRDKWYIENGLELPTDQDIWNAEREKLRAEGKL